ncbi:FAD:protein FMN transferase [Erysipelothrix anatis]|uniref:FAD:protein FMN transferase n=1 Tax=Erysipelothrix anatis TaxID=2683713 RepID=UPI0013567C72|nr:FAD:protein FMN transferase [Erysipelothrix anatis]
MKKFAFIMATLLILTGCSIKSGDNYTKYEARTSEVGFDTVMTFVAYTKDEATFNDYFSKVKAAFLRYNALFDKYNDYEGVANIKTINDNAGIAPVTVDPLIIEMLERSRDYTEVSNGYFDITYGSVMEIWHDYREDGIEKNASGEPGEIPTQDVLEEAALHAGWQFVEIDKANNTVFLTDAKTRLDVGAIAKGYATELVALELEEAGLEYGVVSGGGNVRTINTKPDGEAWAIGVEKPSMLVKNESLDVFRIPHSMSIVTSGDYQRYYIGPNDVTYSHLINPKTLQPQSVFRSVTIFTPDSTMADALSTAVYMMSYEEAQTFIQDFNIKFPDKSIDVLWVSEDHPEWYQLEDYDFTFTDNIKQYSAFANK